MEWINIYSALNTRAAAKISGDSDPISSVGRAIHSVAKESGVDFLTIAALLFSFRKAEIELSKLPMKVSNFEWSLNTHNKINDGTISFTSISSCGLIFYNFTNCWDMDHSFALRTDPDPHIKNAY